MTSCKVYAQELLDKNIAEGLDNMHRDPINGGEAFPIVVTASLPEKVVHSITRNY